MHTVDEVLAFINGATAARLRDYHRDFFGASHAEVVHRGAGMTGGTQLNRLMMPAARWLGWLPSNPAPGCLMPSSFYVSVRFVLR